MWNLVLRTIAIYVIVFLVMRFMGKREIGKLSVLDLVISIMIAEIAVIVIEDVKRPLMEGIVPMTLLMLIQIGLALIGLRSRRLRLWLDGKPTMIIENGKLNREAMKKQRYNLDDLMLQLRENNIASISDVEFAVLETSGKLSVLRKEDSADEPASQTEIRRRDKAVRPFPENFRFEELPVPLIMDGSLVNENLDRLGKDRFWLNTQLKQQGITDYKQVYLCTLDHKGRLFVDARKKPGP